MCIQLWKWTWWRSVNISYMFIQEEIRIRKDLNESKSNISEDKKLLKAAKEGEGHCIHPWDGEQILDSEGVHIYWVGGDVHSELEYIIANHQIYHLRIATQMATNNTNYLISTYVLVHSLFCHKISTNFMIHVPGLLLILSMLSKCKGHTTEQISNCAWWSIWNNSNNKIIKVSIYYGHYKNKHSLVLKFL